VQLFIVDEANFIPPNCYDGLLPHAQKRGGKLMFTSSSASAPAHEKANTCNLDVLRETPGVLFASVTYVCSEHITAFVAQMRRTTCNCFVHLEPFHVDNNAADRSVADRLNDATGRDIGYLLERGVSRNVLIQRGMYQEELPLLLNSTVSNMLENVVDTHAMSGTSQLDTALVVYVDTCAHLTPYSKNGLSVCSRYRNATGTWSYVVLAVDHCYHANSLSEHVSMFQFVPDLILKTLSNVCSLHLHPNDKTTSHFTEAFVVIEYNSYDLTDTVKNLHVLLTSDRPAMLQGVGVSCFYHKVTGQHVFSEQTTFTDPHSGMTKTCNIKPGFVMNIHKTDYFRKVFDMMGTGNVSLSQSLTSIHVEPTGSDSLQDVVMEHLGNIQVKRKGATATYTGKGKGRPDDLAISVFMCIYIDMYKFQFLWKRIDY
jgi:hypothetical protein